MKPLKRFLIEIEALEAFSWSLNPVTHGWRTKAPIKVACTLLRCTNKNMLLTLSPARYQTHLPLTTDLVTGPQDHLEDSPETSGSAWLVIKSSFATICELFHNLWKVTICWVKTFCGDNFVEVVSSKVKWVL